MSTSKETILVQKRMLRMRTKLLSTILVLWITLMMNISNLSSTCVPIHFSSMVIIELLNTSCNKICKFFNTCWPMRGLIPWQIFMDLNHLVYLMQMIWFTYLILFFMDYSLSYLIKVTKSRNGFSLLYFFSKRNAWIIVHQLFY